MKRSSMNVWLSWEVPMRGLKELLKVGSVVNTHCTWKLALNVLLSYVAYLFTTWPSTTGERA